MGTFPFEESFLSFGFTVFDFLLISLSSYWLAKIDVELAHNHSKDMAGAAAAEALLVEVPK